MKKKEIHLLKINENCTRERLRMTLNRENYDMNKLLFVFHFSLVASNSINTFAPSLSAVADFDFTHRPEIYVWFRFSTINMFMVKHVDVVFLFLLNGNYCWWCKLFGILCVLFKTLSNLYLHHVPHQIQSILSAFFLYFSIFTKLFKYTIELHTNEMIKIQKAKW